MDAGYALLIAALVPGLIGWDLSRRGLGKAATASTATKEAADELRSVVGGTQSMLAQETQEDAATLARANQEAVEKANALDSALGQVNEALAGLTGVFAPARVAFALALLLVVASLFALDIISITVAEDAGAAILFVGV